MPFSGAPVLKCNLNTTEPVKIEVLSISGQLVSSKTLLLGEFSVFKLDEFNGVPSGIYFLRISTGTSQQVVRAVKI